MRLALIVPGGFDPGERVIPALNHLAAHLAERHDVRVFAAGGPSGRSRYVRDGYTVEQLAEHRPDRTFLARAILPGRAGRAIARGRALASLADALRRAWRDRPFDVLHVFWAGDAALVTATLGRAMGVPVVVSVGGGEAVWIAEARYGGAYRASGRAELRLALELASAVTAGSDFAASFLPPRARARASIVPLGIRGAAFEGPVERADGPPWRLLHVGDLNLVKRQDVLIAALGLVRAHGFEVTLDLAGEDTRQGALRRLARDVGLGPYVTFHGFVPPSRLPDLYRRAHLHLVASRYESQGVSILEAAAAGLPTVGSPVGLLPTLAPAAAQCVPHGDPAALAAAIVRLIEDAAERHAMGRRARAWASCHDAAWTAARFEAIHAAALDASV